MEERKLDPTTLTDRAVEELEGVQQEAEFSKTTVDIESVAEPPPESPEETSKDEPPVAVENVVPTDESEPDKKAPQEEDALSETQETERADVPTATSATPDASKAEDVDESTDQPKNNDPVDQVESQAGQVDPGTAQDAGTNENPVEEEQKKDEGEEVSLTQRDDADKTAETVLASVPVKEKDQHTGGESTQAASIKAESTDHDEEKADDDAEAHDDDHHEEEPWAPGALHDQLRHLLGAHLYHHIIVALKVHQLPGEARHKAAGGVRRVGQCGRVRLPGPGSDEHRQPQGHDRRAHERRRDRR